MRRKVDFAAEEDDLRPEYDLSRLENGVRGKYLERYRSGTNIALLAPDVRAAFPTDDDVNGALRSLTFALPLSWQKAIVRIREHGENPAYMPTALLAAICYLEERLREGETTNIPIPFENVEIGFKKRMEDLGPAKKGNAYRPFYWLSRGARIWNLFEGTSRTPFTWTNPRQTPPASQLRGKVCARFKKELFPALLDEHFREVIKTELTRLLKQPALQQAGQLADGTESRSRS